MPIISWLLRPILFISAIITGGIVAEDSANFGIVQMVISVLLIVGLVAIATFWDKLFPWLKGRKGDDEST